MAFFFNSFWLLIIGLIEKESLSVSMALAGLGAFLSIIEPLSTLPALIVGCAHTEDANITNQKPNGGNESSRKDRNLKSSKDRGLFKTCLPQFL